MINIAIIEDDALVRENLCQFLSHKRNFTCIVSAGTVDDFFLKADKVRQLDIVLCDIGLPGMSGIDAIPLIRRKFPESSIVILSVYADSDRIFKALCAGAVG